MTGFSEEGLHGEEQRHLPPSFVGTSVLIRKEGLLSHLPPSVRGAGGFLTTCSLLAQGRVQCSPEARRPGPGVSFVMASEGPLPPFNSTQEGGLFSLIPWDRGQALSQP